MSSPAIGGATAPRRPDSPIPELDLGRALARFPSLRGFDTMGAALSPSLVCLDMTSTAKTCTIPLVDMGGSPAEVAESFTRAIKELGFVAVMNVGIDQTVVNAFYEAAERYFAREDKMGQYSGNGLQGFIPAHTEHAKDSDHPNLMEMFQMLGIYSDSFEAYWPSGEFQEKAVALYDMLQESVKHCLRALAVGLREEEDSLAGLLGEGNSVMRAIHYPPVDPEKTPPGSIRSAAHEDICMMTIIPRATAAGLEVLQKDGTFLPVVVPSGAAIINAGDTLMRITNGFIPSTTHRVVNPRGDDMTSHRYSVPFFGQPAQDTLVAVLPSCEKWDETPPPITFGELLQERLKAIGLKK
jgi:isopenicillin N synthase-like dioxygenase